MNVEEKERFIIMEQSVQKIEKDISAIKSAIIGNELSGDRGLVGKMETLENELVSVKKEIKTLSEERIKNLVYIRQLSFILGAVIITIIGAIITKYI